MADQARRHLRKIPLSTFTVDAAAALDGPGWLADMRRTAAEQAAHVARPTEALEEWRYSRIGALDLDRYQLARSPDKSPGRADDSGLVSVQALIAALGRPVSLIETFDGHLVRAHSEQTDSVRIEDWSAPGSQPRVRSDDIGGSEERAEDLFGLLNRAFSPSPVVVDIAAGVVAGPVVVVHWVGADDVVSFPRVSVRVNENAEVSVLEVVAGPGAALVVPSTDLDVGPAARARYLHIQDLSDQAWQLGAQTSRVHGDATLTSAAVCLGGHYARLATESSLVGPGASSRLLALYFAAGDQMHDFRTRQRHAAPKTRSDLLFKGVVANTSRSVYSGLIRVEKGAVGSNAFQTNRNLVLHEGAHADSVPNLEIEDNDVRCSHASAVGPIDEDQRFYLESRGVPSDVAERLIAVGFLGEVLNELPFGELTEPLRGLLADKLEISEQTQAAATGAGASS